MHIGMHQASAYQKIFPRGMPELRIRGTEGEEEEWWSEKRREGEGPYF